MSFDNSRFTFNPWKNYSGVVMEQGRVQLDSDWNEWLAEISRRIQAGTLDILGHAVYNRATTPAAFQITVTPGPDVIIGCGRMYVDGLLAENHGLFKNATWDPALAELSGSPQPPTNPAPAPSSSNTVDFTNQPYYPGATLLTGSGSYLFYLDVWIRPITWLEDPHLIDKAVGVDTTGRLQTIWQVKQMAIPAGVTYTCQTPDSQIQYPAASTGLLNTDVVANPTSGPCCLTAGTGYTGVENQFYRLEIHQAGAPSTAFPPTYPASKGTATFKWSRDNASVTTGVTAINPGTDTANNPVSVLTVMSLGRDQVLGFSAGNWIEILDDWSELWGLPGTLCLIDQVDPSAKTITLTSTIPTGPTTAGSTPPTFPVDSNGNTHPDRHTRIVRWDQAGNVYESDGKTVWVDLVPGSSGDIPVPPPGTTLILEDGITVTFGPSGSGSFNVGDFWTFAARTADGSVEKLVNAPPRGIHHHYTKLSVVAFTDPPSYPDCRTPWSCSDEGDCGCCTCTVGDNVESFGQYSSIQQAINSLPASGGEVCILPGRYYEYVVVYNLSDVVIHGCGGQTRLASPSMQPKGTADESTSTTPTVKPESGLAAIITVIGSSDIELSSFAIEAADNEAGILLDGTQVTEHHKLAIKKGGGGSEGSVMAISEFPSDVVIKDLAIAASTLPAIVAVNTYILKITGNRIAMQDVSSNWAAVYASGTEIHIDHNWIGLQDANNATSWMPLSVTTDVSSGFNSAAAPATPLANGGIQIAGDSQDVFVQENEIEGGAFNAISLGSFLTVDSTGTVLNTLNGLFLTSPLGPVGTTLMVPPRDTKKDSQIVAAGGLQNIQITGNRIRNVGLCGIGPVGFFNLEETLEVISIVNLTITGNTISGTLQGLIAPFPEDAEEFGYGAVCISDVQNLILRDNTITDFGNTPGLEVCGIYILNGEQVEISRNQVLETRDWSAIPTPAGSPISGLQAGIGLMYVTPPALDPVDTGSAWLPPGTEGPADPLTVPIYQPGIPALRVEQNVVRLPLGPALAVVGEGPFSFVNNHLSTGGTVAASPSPQGLLTVAIMNVGRAIELDTPGTTYTDLFANASASNLKVAGSALASSSSGAVLFNDNHCQLETRADQVSGFASVAILTLDHLIFANNHCWLDGPATAIMDLFLLAGSLQACGNRLQEAVGSVAISGFTFGIVNMTAHNFSTYCLFALGPLSLGANGFNLVADFTLCSPKDDRIPSPPDNATKAIPESITFADATAAQRIQNVGLVRQARVSQLTRAAASIATTYGATSTQAAAAQAAITISKATIARIAIVKDQVTTAAPAVTATGWAHYGHVYNAQLQPVSAYTVFLVNAQKTYQQNYGFAYTDATGYFSLSYAGAEGESKEAAPQLFLEIANAKGQPIYLSSTPFQPALGSATYRSVTLPSGEPPIGDPPPSIRNTALPETGGAST